MLYMGLAFGAGLGKCENCPCALNNSDSVEEDAASSSLLLCPGCLRKLHIGGVIVDVQACMANVAAVLQNIPLAQTSGADDLASLRQWGFLI